MDRRSDSSNGQIPPAFFQEEDDQRQQQERVLEQPDTQQNLAKSSSPRRRHVLQRRSSSQRSISQVQARPLESPTAHELAHTDYPVPSNHFVQRAVRFYVKHYSPSAIQRPHFIGVGQDLSLLRDYIPFILHDRMVFCALVAMSSMSANIAATGDRQRSPDTLRFYHLAVSLLRQRLAEESQRSTDAVIITLSNLCGFEALAGNYEAVDMHTQGIKQVVSLRGGVENLGFDGFLKTIAIAWQTFYASRHSVPLDNELFFPADGNFTYPDHPFNPELCDAIAKFRSGLTDIALSGLLSHQIINLIAHISAWDQDMNTSLRECDVYSLHDMSANSRNVTLCGEFLHKEKLTLIEQLLVLALMAYCYSTDTTRAMFWLTNAYLQVRCRHFQSLYIEVTERNEAFMTWVSTILVATFDPGAQPWLLGLSILRSRPIFRDWQANVRLCEGFFWNDVLSLKLASKIDHLREAERRGQG